MSMILDALRRSERDRHREQAPTLRSIHAQFQPRQRPGAPMGVIGVVALVVCAAGLGVWLGRGGHLPGFDSPAKSDTTTMTPPAPAPVATAPVVTDSPAPQISTGVAAPDGVTDSHAAAPAAAASPAGPLDAPGEWQTVHPDPLAMTPQGATSEAAQQPALQSGVSAIGNASATTTTNGTQLLELWQLSEAEQRYLQSLNVSLHVYSTEPAQRTVIINGLRTREGQPLGQDLQLLEITSDGIIVSFQQQRVHLQTIER